MSYFSRWSQHNNDVVMIIITSSLLCWLHLQKSDSPLKGKFYLSKQWQEVSILPSWWHISVKVHECHPTGILLPVSSHWYNENRWHRMAALWIISTIFLSFTNWIITVHEHGARSTESCNHTYRCWWHIAHTSRLLQPHTPSGTPFDASFWRLQITRPYPPRLHDAVDDEWF